MVLSPKRRVLLLKTAVWTLCLVPLGLGLHRLFLGDGFGADAIKGVEHFTGRSGLIVLLALLCVTPLRRLAGWNDLQKVRRLVGLFAFFYVFLHFMVWIGLDQFFGWSYIGEDLLERPFIYLGFTAFLMLLALALTSTRGWIRRLGRNWTRLHRLVYVASFLGIVHFLWATKADDRWPMAAFAAWGLLMAARLPWRRLRGGEVASIATARRSRSLSPP